MSMLICRSSNKVQFRRLRLAWPVDQSRNSCLNTNLKYVECLFSCFIGDFILLELGPSANSEVSKIGISSGPALFLKTKSIFRERSIPYLVIIACNRFEYTFDHPDFTVSKFTEIQLVFKWLNTYYIISAGVLLRILEP